MIDKFYSVLFRPGERVCWSTSPYGVVTYPVEDCLLHINSQFFCINPLKHLRKDSECTSYRNILIEFDKGSILEQMKHLRDSGIPYSTLVYSGNKSVHAIIALKDSLPNKKTYKYLATMIYDRFDSADKSVSNPSRFSRSPGAVRDNKEVQSIIALRDTISLETVEDWLGKKIEVQVPRIMTKTNTIGKKLLRMSTKMFLSSGAETGNWNNALFRACCDMFVCKYTAEEVLSLCENINGYLDDKDIGTVYSALNTVRAGYED